MTPNFPFNFRFFGPNMVTYVLIAKYLRLFCVISFISDNGKLDSFGNVLLFEFYQSWDIVDPTYNVN